MDNNSNTPIKANLKKKEVGRFVLYKELSKYYTAEEIDQMLATISEGGFVDLRSYQKKLVSGENIKTINNQSILGAGNINIEGGGAGFLTVPIRLQNGFVTAADGEFSNADFESMFGPVASFEPTKHRFEVLLSKGLNTNILLIPASYNTETVISGSTIHSLYAKNGDEVIQVTWSIINNQYYGDWHYSKAGSISTNSSQNLDATQKETARENMSAVGYDAQNLTKVQQKQVQQNIGLEKDVAGGVVSLDDNLKIAPERIQTASIEDIRQLFSNTTNQ